METVQAAEVGPQLAHRQQEHLHRPGQGSKPQPQQIPKSRPQSQNQTHTQNQTPAQAQSQASTQKSTRSRSQPQSPASKPPLTSQSQSLTRPTPRSQSRSQPTHNCQHPNHKHTRRHLRQSTSSNQQQSQFQLTRSQQLINTPSQAITSSTSSNTTTTTSATNRPHHHSSDVDRRIWSESSSENPGQPFMAYQHKHALHRLRRLKKRSPHRDLVISFVPRLRISIINRLDFFHRYSKQEQEVLSCFDFLDELVLNYCDEESVESPQNSPKLYNSANYELI